jgi:hypothetical protein
MTRDHSDVDSSDTFDAERAYDWQVGLHERGRLLSDGRTVTPMTLEDMRAEKAAAMRVQFAKYGDVIATPYDYTSDREAAS